MQLCRKCETRLDPVEETQEYHPYCTPVHQKLPGAPMSLFEMEVREDLLEVIQWGNMSSPRTRQVALGCSEAGGDCDRRIAYTIVGVEKVNWPDPLKANMGTAYHTWLDLRMTEYQEINGIREWLTETEVWPAKFLKGHVDLYSTKRKLVLDWKTTSAENLKLWRKEGIPEKYLIQIMLYGKGMINLGHQVDRVGIVAISRSGALRDVLVLSVPYDEEIVNTALRRVWQIGKAASDLDLENNMAGFAKIANTPSRMCGYCPWYKGGYQPADGSGCPGTDPGNDFDRMFGVR